MRSVRRTGHMYRRLLLAVWASACRPEDPPAGPPPRLDGVEFVVAGSHTSTFSSTGLYERPLVAWAVVDLEWAPFTGDSSPELVAAAINPNDDEFHAGAVVVLEPGNGAIVQIESYALPGEFAAGVRSVSPGDLDDDGDQDLVVGTQAGPSYGEYDGEVETFLNDGIGQFTYETRLGDWATTDDVIAADLDQDGDVDVAATAKGAGDGDTTFYGYPVGGGGVLPALTVWRNLGDGEFVWSAAVEGRAYSLTMRASSEGSVLLAIVHSSSIRSYKVVEGDLVPVVQAEGGGGPVSLAYTDADGDGDLDLLQATEGRVRLLPMQDEQLGVGWTEESGCVDDWWVSCRLEVADFDLDGDEDFVFGSEDGVAFYANDGDGTYAQAILLPGLAGGIALTDRDGDGDVDVAIGTDTEITVYDNTLLSPASP
jgi:FG-GAP-like repeat